MKQQRDEAAESNQNGKREIERDRGGREDRMQSGRRDGEKEERQREMIKAKKESL